MTTPRRPILLVNPPLIGGIAFTRQGRCQEREEVLGTTKPPYSLAVMAALVRQREIPVRLVDLTAEQRSTESLIGELRKAGASPALIVWAACITAFRPEPQTMLIVTAGIEGERPA